MPPFSYKHNAFSVALTHTVPRSVQIELGRVHQILLVANKIASVLLVAERGENLSSFLINDIETANGILLNLEHALAAYVPIRMENQLQRHRICFPHVIQVVIHILQMVAD